MMIHKTHELFTSSDFTDDEIARGIDLAISVVEHKLFVCKRCGELEKGLEHPCRRSRSHEDELRQYQEISFLKHQNA